MNRLFVFLPVAALLGAALAGVSAVAAHEVHRNGAASVPPPPFEKLFGGPFDLIDHHGMRRTDRDYRGRYMLIFFGYTDCAAICPTNLQHMAEALDRLGADAARIQPLFITTDPSHDTPERLKDYMAAFGPRFVGLTGSQAAIRHAAKGYRVHRRKVLLDDDGDEEKGAGHHDGDNAGHEAYLVDHSSLTYLIGPDGRFLTLFPHDTDGAVMAKRIRRYLAVPQS